MKFKIRSMFILNNEGILGSHVVGEWFNGKTADCKVADLGSNPCFLGKCSLLGSTTVSYRM